MGAAPHRTLPHRTLVVMRHAEADMPWGTGDYDRPLTRRGHDQAAAAGTWLLEHGTVPEMMVCSSALRTRQTCTWVGEALGEKAPTASLEKSLYNCSPEELLRVVRRTPDSVRSLLVIAHYPAVQEAVLRLAARDSDYPAVMDASSGFQPASTAVFSVPGSWSGLEEAGAVLEAFAAH